MNAYELADAIEDWATAANYTISIKAGKMLRAQAKRIEELEKVLKQNERLLTTIFEQRQFFEAEIEKKNTMIKMWQATANKTHPHKELSDEEIQKAFNQWLMLDEGFVRFDYQLKHEWVAEQWERWQQAFKLARGEE